jgi:hypothetical protein
VGLPLLPNDQVAVKEKGLQNLCELPGRHEFVSRTLRNYKVAVGVTQKVFHHELAVADPGRKLPAPVFKGVPYLCGVEGSHKDFRHEHGPDANGEVIIVDAMGISSIESKITRRPFIDFNKDRS